VKLAENSSPHILVVDDHQLVRKTLTRIFTRAGYRTTSASNGKGSLELFLSQNFNLAIVDLKLPDQDGMAVARKMISKKPSVPIILISGYGTIAKAVEATKAGIYDFLEKPIVPDRLLMIVRHALEQQHLKQELARYKADSLARYQMLGQTPQMKQVFNLIEKVAPTSSAVLIVGENGVGKELVAQAIHSRSQVAKKRMVKINCAAIPDNLLESELFGHVRGAFTGAVQTKLGRFEIGNGSSVFLDEIGELSQALQAKLLRFLESGEIQKVGATNVNYVDVRVIAASNRNLDDMIKNNTFREDLFYRLNVFTIRVPPLRERVGDIQILLEHFIDKFTEEYGINKPRLSPSALNFLIGFHWPGNIRQLQNFVNKLTLLKRSEWVDLAEVQQFIETAPNFTPPMQSKSLPFNTARILFEQQYITQVLEKNDWQVSKAAEELGLERSYLYRKMKRLGISK